jgi:hypothetical protein
MSWPVGCCWQFYAQMLRTAGFQKRRQKTPTRRLTFVATFNLEAKITNNIPLNTDVNNEKFKKVRYKKENMQTKKFD